MQSKSVLTILLVSFLCLASCSSGPSKPQPGTPGYYWQGAKETFAAGDYMKTIEDLDRAARDSALAPQALTWSVVVHAGVVKGYLQLADAYAEGAAANKANPAMFRRQTSNYWRAARVLSLQFAEKFREFQTSNKDEQIKLTFPFPSGSPAEPPLISRIKTGTIPLAADAEESQRLQLTRAVIMMASDAAGAGEDSSKAVALFKTGEVKIPRTIFMMAMARALADTGDLYTRKKLDDPDRLKLFADAATEALKGVPEDLEVKALTQRLKNQVKPPEKKRM